MSLRAMVSQQTPPYASERILFRTRSEFLTDQRVIVDGEIYPLRSVEQVKVARLIYFWPLQATRLLAALLSWALILDIFGIVALNLPVDSVIMGGVLVLLLAAFAYVVPGLVPTHVVQFETSRGTVRVFYSSDTDHLHGIARNAEQAMAQLDS